ncbi:MAG: magnesium transporter CorA family protein [Candidatus Nanoarchaeia archaeon]|nr:magnesium transporter CorA family protein [Candidatus Nanoarchaeia archaeon]
MIEILEISENELIILNKTKKNCWINVFSPTEEEIQKLKKIIDIPEELLTSLKDIAEIPTIEEYPKFTFIIIRSPYNNLRDDYEYYTVPVGIFLTDNLVLTLYYHENDVIPKLKKQRFPFRKTQLIFRLLLTSARLYLSYLNEINQKIYAIEKALEKSQKNEAIMRLLDIEKSLVYFSTSLKSNEILVERIEKEKILIKTYEDKKMIEKVIDENKQAIEMTKTYSSILVNTLDAFASVISNNLNIVMKFLAAVTIIIAIPTLIASVYGMNIGLPFQGSPQAFLIVIMMSLVGVLAAIFIFWKKKFF